MANTTLAGRTDRQPQIDAPGGEETASSGLRILVCSEQFLPTRGGSVTWLVQTYRRFAPREVVVLAASQPGDSACDCALPFRVERMPMAMTDWDPTVPASLQRYLHMLWRMARRCSADQIQQVHCLKVLPEGLVAWALRRCYGMPYLLYAHGEEILTALSSRKLAWCLPRIYRGAAAIIANAQHTRHLLADLGVPVHKIHVIHPGVDAEACRATPEVGHQLRARLRLGTAPVLLTVGRLQRRKGQDMVIRALPHILQVVPQVQYVVVGGGEERGALHTLATDLGVQEHIRWAGEVPDGDLAAYYTACDVFIMPNRQIDGDIEGFGMVFLEAGAAGKPVIGGRGGGTADAIVDGVTGMLVDGTSTTEIAAAALDLLTNRSKAASLGYHGQQRVAREFTWDAIVRRTRALASTISHAR